MQNVHTPSKNKKKRVTIARPRVGVSVFIDRDSPRGMQILLGLRQGKHGDSTWALPGGNLEFGETWPACARREVNEETGVLASKFEFVGVTNDLFLDHGLHYVTIFLHAREWRGKPHNLEPDKCRELKWVTVDELPAPLFGPLETCLRQWKILPKKLAKKKAVKKQAVKK